MKLVLGTAEFSKDGYNGQPPIPRTQILRILNLAWTAGIRTLDTAESYNCDESLFVGFKQLRKTRDPVRGIYHYKQDEARLEHVKDASVYTLDQIPELPGTIIVPINPERTEFIDRIKRIQTVYARSVFGNGELLKKGYSVQDCLQFVSRCSVEGVIIGIRHVMELEEVLKSLKDQII